MNLVGVLKCGWCLLLQLQKLLLEVGDSLRHHLKLGILHPDRVLEMHDLVCAVVHLLTGKVNLLPGIVHPVLGSAKAAVQDL
jgi:hypothetical protein